MATLMPLLRETSHYDGLIAIVIYVPSARFSLRFTKKTPLRFFFVAHFALT